MYRYRAWGWEQVERHDRYLSERLPDCDTFFASSIAIQAALNERTFRNYLGTDPTLQFVGRVESGEIGTHTNSIHTWRQSRSHNDARMNVTTWQTNFIRDVQVTEVGSGSAVGARKNDEKK